MPHVAIVTQHGDALGAIEFETSRLAPGDFVNVDGHGILLVVALVPNNDPELFDIALVESTGD